MIKNKKGFTLVELVIVIAVIAILSAVLLPTFAGILERAKETSRIQQIESIRREIYSGSETFDSINDLNEYIFKIDNNFYKVENGVIVNYSKNITENFENQYTVSQTHSSISDIIIYLPKENTDVEPIFDFTINESTKTATIVGCLNTPTGTLKIPEYIGKPTGEILVNYKYYLDFYDLYSFISFSDDYEKIYNIECSNDNENYNVSYQISAMDIFRYESELSQFSSYRIAFETVVYDMTEKVYSITSIDGNILQGNTSITKIIFPNTMKSTGRFSFSGCENLVEIVLNEGLTNLEDYTFENCHNLEKVILPESLTNIGSLAFYECEKLTSITIPSKITKIGDFAFAYCTSLTELNLPEGLLYIGDQSFRNCTSLVNLVIPESVQTLRQGCFDYCYSLKEVFIPKNVSKLDNAKPFRSCTSLENIVVDPENTTFYSSKNNVELNAVYKTSDNALMIGCKNSIIIEECQTIADQAFYGSSIVNLVLPDSILTIGSYAFDNCKSLETVKFSSTLTSISGGAFASCDNLKDFTLPDSLTSIGSQAFMYCKSLTSITIPKNVKTIGYGCFTGCENLNSVTFVNKTGWKIGNTSVDVSNPTVNAQKLLDSNNGTWMIK